MRKEGAQAELGHPRERSRAAEGCSPAYRHRGLVGRGQGLRRAPEKEHHSAFGLQGGDFIP